MEFEIKIESVDGDTDTVHVKIEPFEREPGSWVIGRWMRSGSGRDIDQVNDSLFIIDGVAYSPVEGDTDHAMVSLIDEVITEDSP